MEILEAFDLTGTLRGAAELVGCDHKTVAHWVRARDEAGGGLPVAARPKPRVDAFAAKVEEWVERSHAEDPRRRRSSAAGGDGLHGVGAHDAPRGRRREAPMAREVARHALTTPGQPRIDQAHYPEDLLAERALATDAMRRADIAQLRALMDEGRARRLQPHYIEGAFRAAFTRLGGKIRRREQSRFEITHVPAQLRTVGRGPIASRYERVTFDIEHVLDEKGARAELLAPRYMRARGPKRGLLRRLRWARWRAASLSAPAWDEDSAPGLGPGASTVGSRGFRQHGAV